MFNCFLDRPTVSLLISPSITPWRRPRGAALGRNPALRAISYEVNSPYKLKDYTQYYLPLDKANNPNRTGSVEWEEEYNFTRKYTGISDLTPQVRRVKPCYFRFGGTQKYLIPSCHSSTSWCIMANASMWCLLTTIHKVWHAEHYYRQDTEIHTFQR